MVFCKKIQNYSLIFGEIFSRLPQTPPHHLVLRIIDPKPFSSAATEWGKVHESVALVQYIKYHKDRGNVSLVASNAGFVISEDEPYLGHHLMDMCMIHPLWNVLDLWKLSVHANFMSTP